MTQNYTPRPDGIDVRSITSNLNKCLENDGGVDTKFYIDAFQEIARFYEMIGALFTPMAIDIREQNRILGLFLQSGQRDHYTTIEKMTAFESADPANRLEPKKKSSSGSRAALHLHRIMEFLLQFMTKVKECGDNDKLSGMGNAVYKDTLAKHHSWFMTKAAAIAISTVPTKIQFYEKTSKYPYAETTDALFDLLEALKRVYAAADGFFTMHDLHKLPY